MTLYSETETKPYRKRKLYRRFFSDSEVILDIGCSVGNFIQHAPEKIIGIDIDRDALYKAHSQGFIGVYGDIRCGLPFRDDSFDAVNCDSVIEHLSDPLSLIKEIYRVLKPGGKAIIITPNIFRIKHKFWFDYNHVKPFCPSSLLQLGYDGGFRNCKVLSYSLNYLRPVESVLPVNASWVLWVIEDIFGKIFASNIYLRAIK